MRFIHLYQRCLKDMLTSTPCLQVSINLYSNRVLEFGYFVKAVYIIEKPREECYRGRSIKFIHHEYDSWESNNIT